MITFSRLGQVGRLGNQLFQIAFMTAFAERYHIQYALPYWKYADYFDYPFVFRTDLNMLQYDMTIREPALGYHEQYFRDLLPAMQHQRINIITGYFQSYKYFSKEHILKIFRFKNDLTINANKCIAISVRRGDFVKHKHFNNIEAETFRRLLKNFRSFKVFVFTDDYNYCKREFIGNEYEFMEGLNDIQQLQLLSKFEYYILSNSTFSYWGPMLHPSPKCILYPKYMFPDMDRCDLYNREYWPPEEEYISYINPVNKYDTGYKTRGKQA